MMHEVGRLLDRNRDRAWVQTVDSWFLEFHKVYVNRNYDMQSNGELPALKRLGARIHAFEIVPETFHELQIHLQGRENIVLNNIGLSDTEGALTVYFSRERHGLATCVAGFSEAFHHYHSDSLQTTATIGDHYCTEGGIDVIDLLKVDVEGLEPQVLREFETMLREAESVSCSLSMDT